MGRIKNIIENKTLLVGLVVCLLLVATVQSVFLVKLYRAVDQGSPEEIAKKFDKNFDLQDDFLNRFDDQTWDPFAELQSMRERMERMFDDSYNRFRRSPFFDEDRIETFLPQTDLIEEDDRYVVKMNIPGSDTAEINVDVVGEQLTVKAKTQTAKGNKKGDLYLRMERSVGSFQRSIQLPGPVDASAMETKYEDGVFTIILPKQK